MRLIKIRTKCNHQHHHHSSSSPHRHSPPPHHPSSRHLRRRRLAMAPCPCHRFSASPGAPSPPATGAAAGCRSVLLTPLASQELVPELGQLRRPRRPRQACRLAIWFRLSHPRAPPSGSCRPFAGAAPCPASALFEQGGGCASARPHRPGTPRPRPAPGRTSCSSTSPKP